MISSGLRRTTTLLIAGLMLFSSLFFYMGPNAQAVTEGELRDKTEKLEDEIAASEAVLADLEDQAQTLENKLYALETEISTANKKIELSKLELEKLVKALNEAKAELARQQNILKENLRTLYMEGDVSTLELLFATESFSDFFSQQEYLERLKLGVQTSADQVKDLRDQIAQDKKDQEKLLAKQKQQKQLLADKRAEQQSLLNQTKGQEAAYQDIVADLQKQLEEAEKELEEFLRNQNFVSLGKVAAGDLIGYMGSTGYSTGPHLHFAVWSGGQFVNPVAGWGNLINDYIWPTPTRGWDYVTQDFGCVAPYYWYITKCNNGKSFHGGLDVGGWYGDSILAADAGDIVYRGWLGGYGNVVIIDHGGGVQTYYAHLNQ